MACDGGAEPGDWKTVIAAEKTVADDVRALRAIVGDYTRVQLESGEWAWQAPQPEPVFEQEDEWIIANYGWPCCPHRYRAIQPGTANYDRKAGNATES